VHRSEPGGGRAFGGEVRGVARIRRVDLSKPPSLVTRIMSRLALTRGARLISRRIGWRLDPILLRLTGGRLSTTVVIPTGVLETRGRHCGHRRRNAVIYVPDGDGVVIAASNAGAACHPDWFHNLSAAPEVTFNGIPMVAAAIGDPTEQARLWPLADRVFPGFAAYRREAAEAGRSIPLIRLSPSAPGGGGAAS